MRFKLLWPLALCSLGFLSLNACGPNAEQIEKEKYEKEKKDGETLATNKAAAIEKAKKSLEIQELKPGSGSLILEDGDLGMVVYRGTRMTGEVFDTNTTPDSNPYPVRISGGGTIEGFNFLLKGMKVGQKRKATLPPILAYGEEGQLPKIQPNETLIFEVEVLEIVKANDESFYTKKILKEGTGAPAEPGDEIFVHYTGRLTNGKEFDTSRKPRNPGEPIKPLNFVLGAGRVIKGWDTGFVGMKKGEKRIMRVGPAAGYGENAPPNIGPNQVLEFDIECVDIKKK